MRFSALSTLTLALSLSLAQAAQEYDVFLWESDSECKGPQKAVRGIEGKDEGPTGHSECLDINTRKYHSVSSYTEDTCCDFFSDYKCKGDKRTQRSVRPGACFGGFKPVSAPASRNWILC